VVELAVELARQPAAEVSASAAPNRRSKSEHVYNFVGRVNRLGVSSGASDGLAVGGLANFERMQPRLLGHRRD
jgi:hypothetical protein